MTGQPVVSPTLILPAGRGLLEIVRFSEMAKVISSNSSASSQRRPLMGLAHQPGVVHGDPTLLRRLQRVGQRLQRPRSLGLLASPTTTKPELAAQLLNRILALQISETPSNAARYPSN